MAMAHDRFISAGHRPSPWHTLKTFWARTREGRAYLDTRSLPEHLQRDIGILDGNPVFRKSLERCGDGD